MLSHKSLEITTTTTTIKDRLNVCAILVTQGFWMTGSVAAVLWGHVWDDLTKWKHEEIKEEAEPWGDLD